MPVTYLDSAATTPMDPRVCAAVADAMATVYGNPSSLYAAGRAAKAAVEKARRQVAALIGAKPEEIFFTSGGSESDNWALKGMALARRAAGQPCGIVTSAIEHPAVLRTCAWLEAQGIPVTKLPVDAEGLVSPEALDSVLDDASNDSASAVGIVSVMMANNEVGTIEPIAELARVAHVRGALFHTDAVQAAGHIPIDAQALGIDALSLTAHKFCGPKGVGALYVRRGVAIDPLIHGGEQERGLRAGTENVPGIVGLGCAAELAAAELVAEAERLKELRGLLASRVQAIPGCTLHQAEDDAQRLPGILNFGITGVRHDALLIRLDRAGFAISAGSACSAGSLEPSHVLAAMGVPSERAQEAVRVSMGRFTTRADVLTFADALAQTVTAMRNH
ncbi:cysteine desulfurase family protein [Selenomonas sp.]|uniref:cysteine desulfurase family protein n=1 Tax=Selenomonas sp. TaxID=2053611 RepID=UPI0025CD8AB6|nr:cysteine desulfurase family protein [Selenomonas sp.]MCI6284955.1 cysteine desulfurase [Selenomonas sp.]